jgi:hypothetical protein
MTQCEVCGWTLKEKIEDGCVPGNCSYRPEQGSEEYRRIQERRVWLKAQVHWIVDGKAKCGSAGTGVEIESAFHETILKVTCPECATVLLAELQAAQ